MYGELYLAIFALLILIFIVAIVAILTSSARKRSTFSSTLGNIRQQVESIQKGMHDLQGQIWQYGTNEEEKGKNWRISCLSMAQKAVTVLQSCWLEREENEYAQAVYDELLMGLKRVGIEEVVPTLGEVVDEEDTIYRIVKREGQPPFRISKVVYPGYNFKTKLVDVDNEQDIIVLERAVVEVLGNEK